MARYIDADALIEEMKECKYANPCNDYQRGVNASIDIHIVGIKHMPSADVVPRSEVAREIFGEISRIVCGEINAVQLDAYNMHIYGDGNQVKEWEKVSYLRGMRRMYDVLYELKKKYEEGKK